jgi:phosphohistidine phosphatase
LKMKTLLILRHAKSSWKDESLPDHDRPLNKRGKEEAPRMGRLIRELGLTPDLILSSTAKRARTTAELVAEEAGYEGEIILSRDLYATGPDAFIEALAGLEDAYQRVMVVGHNPGLEELLEALTGEYQPLTTAALAQVRLEIDRWNELTDDVEGKLINVWVPKEL